jgi:hypothetical protein
VGKCKESNNQNKHTSILQTNKQKRKKKKKMKTKRKKMKKGGYGYPLWDYQAQWNIS